MLLTLTLSGNWPCGWSGEATECFANTGRDPNIVTETVCTTGCSNSFLYEKDRSTGRCGLIGCIDRDIDGSLFAVLFILLILVLLMYVM